LLDMFYPVGSIYMSVDSTSPAIRFGGTWERIENTFLLAAGSNYTAGSTGGSTTTTLSTNNLPAHNHEANSTYNGADFDIRAGSSNDRYLVEAGNNTTVGSGEGAKKWNAAFSISSSAPNRKNDKVYIGGTVTTTTNNTGSGEAFSNMPPYLAVYMWKRTK
jgi:microcystin-dependent protein